MIDSLIALIIFGCGYWIGKRSAAGKQERLQPEVQEQQRLQEDRTAFSQLMGYNAERAYGLHDQE